MTKSADTAAIADIRKTIREAFGSLSFKESSHSYTLGGNSLRSVSNCVKQYKQPFDTDTVAAAYAKKNKLKVEDVKKQWNDKSKASCDFGTMVHNFAEDRFYNRHGESINGHTDAVLKFWDEIPDTIKPVMAEARVYSEPLKFAGTFDNLFYCTERDGVIITDYKGLPLDTPIITTSGWKTMGTLELTDCVFDKDGYPVVIKHLSQIHHNPCYRITFDNNESIVADHEHRWMISFTDQHKDYDKVMTTEELHYHLSNYPRESRFIPKIKNPKPLKTKETKLPIDPYVFGVWLGDGHSACGMITNMNPEIWKEIENRGYSLGKDVSGGGAGKAQSRTVFGISTTLKNLGLLKNKHLPIEYLLCSYEQRLDVLRGFMDADGYYNPGRKRFVMGTTKKWQADAVAELVASLGWKPTIISCIKKCNGKEFKGLDVCFTTNGINPFLIRNQNAIDYPSRTNKDYRTIISVEIVETVPTRCIEVDSPSHTFLVGKTLLVTHNTNEDLHKNFKNQRMLEPFDFLLDTPFHAYELQLSMYQVPLEDIGLKVVNRFIIWLKPDGTYERIKATDYTDHLRYYLTLN